MRIPMLAAALCLMSVACAAGARAEDFSGFYAGVNAGYGFGRERGDRDAAPGTAPAGPGAQDDAKLPPSAASAARAMRSGRDGAAKGR
ncbi:hypothetical protein [Methylobacterium sp. sgz302541]|uniref:hypothetical protein n=1 Tax=unclassified Methylobacterium TaxID=2615210 RepID=UPI003D33598D